MLEPDNRAPVMREAWFSSSLIISEPCRGKGVSFSCGKGSQDQLLETHLPHECRYVHGVGGESHSKDNGCWLPHKACH